MADANNVLTYYPNILDVKFPENEYGQFQKSVVEEIKQTSVMNSQAGMLEATHTDQNKGSRDTELDNTAYNMDLDEGFHATKMTAKSEYTCIIGRTGNAKSFEMQGDGEYDKSAYAMKIAEDLKKCTDGLNRKEANALIYGNQNTDSKSFNGLAYYTSRLTDLTTFQNKMENFENPFTDDQCVCIDNQRNVTATNALTEDELSQAKFASIYAIVWGRENVAKLFPRGDVGGIGIRKDDTLPPYRKEYTDPVDNIVKFRWYRDVTMSKFTGVNVANRFSLIRIANIRMDRNGDAFTEEMERIEDSGALVQYILNKAGLSGMAMWYAPEMLVNQLKKFRKLGVTQVNYMDAGAGNTGKPHGIMPEIPFYLNDSVELQKENYLLTNETIVE